MKKKKSEPIIVGKPPSQMNGPYWRKATDNVTEEILKLPKAKVVSYFKVRQRTRGGAKLDIRFWKTLSNGYMVFVDETNCRIGIVQGFSGFYAIEGSNKREFERAHKKVMRVLK